MYFQGRIQEFLIGGGPMVSEGVFRGLPQKSLRFQALKSAFWWILEIVFLWIMEKAKKPLRSDWGSGSPDPPPGSATDFYEYMSFLNHESEIRTIAYCTLDKIV